MTADHPNLADLHALDKAATPAPWHAVAGAWGLPSDGPDHMRVVSGQHQNATDAVARLEYERQGGDDAALIAAYRNATPALVAALTDVLARLVEWEFNGKRPTPAELCDLITNHITPDATASEATEQED